MLYLHKPILRDFVVDLSIEYSERRDRLTLMVETENTGKDPLQVDEGRENYAVAIVKGLPESIEHRREHGRSRFDIVVRTR